jgi:hypothetical protein
VTYRKGEAAFDGWSWVHAAGGFVLGLSGLYWPWALAAIAAYELLEGGLRRIKVEEGGLFEYESWPNIFADIAVGSLGYAIGRYAIPYHWPFA